MATIGEGLASFGRNYAAGKQAQANLALQKEAQKLQKDQLQLRQDMFDQEMLLQTAKQAEVDRLKGAIRGSQEFIRNMEAKKSEAVPFIPDETMDIQSMKISTPEVAPLKQGQGLEFGAKGVSRADSFISDMVKDSEATPTLSLGDVPEGVTQTFGTLPEIAKPERKSAIDFALNTVRESKKKDLLQRAKFHGLNFFPTLLEAGGIVVDKVEGLLGLSDSEFVKATKKLEKEYKAERLKEEGNGKKKEKPEPTPEPIDQGLSLDQMSKGGLEGVPELKAQEDVSFVTERGQDAVVAVFKTDDEIAQEVEQGLLNIDGFLELPQATQKGIRDAAFMARDERRAREMHEATVGNTKADIATKEMKLAASEAEMNRMRMRGGAPEEDAHKLRSQYHGLNTIRDYNTVQAAFEKIRFSGDPKRTPTAQSDLSLIFAYMRILDPNSVVRESEFKLAENAQEYFGKLIENGELTDREIGMLPIIKQQLERVQTGRLLLDSSRDNMVKEAVGVFKGQVTTAVKGIRQYTDFEDEQGWRSGTVVPVEDRALLKSFDNGTLLGSMTDAPTGETQVGRFTVKEIK